MSMLFQVRGEVLDLLGQECRLNFGGSGVTLMGGELLNDLFLGFIV